MTHSDYRDLLAPYALDVIDPADRQALDEHLATCAECRDELSTLRESSSLLAHAATQREPGDHVRAQLLAKVRAESRPQKSAQVVQMPPRQKIWPNVFRLAAAIAFVALLVGIVVLWRRDARLQAEAARLTAQLKAQQKERDRERDLIAHQREALALLNSSAATKIQLKGMPASPNARATFVFDKQSGHAVLMTEGLPTTSADKAYEVWFIPKGHSPMPGKVFTVDSSGHAMVMDQMPAEAMANAVIAITVEPKKGSTAPTGAMYLASPAS